MDLNYELPSNQIGAASAKMEQKEAAAKHATEVQKAQERAEIVKTLQDKIISTVTSLPEYHDALAIRELQQQLRPRWEDDSRPQTVTFMRGIKVYQFYHNDKEAEAITYLRMSDPDDKDALVRDREHNYVDIKISLREPRTGYLPKDNTFSFQSPDIFEGPPEKEVPVKNEPRVETAILAELEKLTQPLIEDPEQLKRPVVQLDKDLETLLYAVRTDPSLDQRERQFRTFILTNARFGLRGTNDHEAITSGQLRKRPSRAPGLYGSNDFILQVMKQCGALEPEATLEDLQDKQDWEEYARYIPTARANYLPKIVRPTEERPEANLHGKVLTLPTHTPGISVTIDMTTYNGDPKATTLRFQGDVFNSNEANNLKHIRPVRPLGDQPYHLAPSGGVTSRAS